MANTGEWCPGEDSNLHELLHWYLKPARLPVPPPGQDGSLKREAQESTHPPWACQSVRRLSGQFPEYTILPPTIVMSTRAPAFMTCSTKRRHAACPPINRTEIGMPWPTRIGYRTGSLETVRGLVGHGLGYSVLATKPVNNMSYDGRALAARPLATPVTGSRLVLAAIEGRPLTALTQEFAVHCRSFFGVPHAHAHS